MTEIEQWNPPHEFVDVQRKRKGPYRLWRHTHTFSPLNAGASIVDMVEYALPFGLLGRLIHRLRVARDLSRILDDRQQRIYALFAQKEKASTVS
ncbi:MAG TPA: hypothetical protein VK604_27700 [Bryobacteraceae bacterium]|nr:hypothetical protein [Bryobacteraceae bacterium]